MRSRTLKTLGRNLIKVIGFRGWVVREQLEINGFTKITHGISKNAFWNLESLGRSLKIP